MSAPNGGAVIMGTDVAITIRTTKGNTVQVRGSVTGQSYDLTTSQLQRMTVVNARVFDVNARRYI
jgi:hypothetical protein